MNTALPFPLHANLTPVASADSFHREDDERAYEGMYFTFPIEHLRPSPCTFDDHADTLKGMHHAALLSMLFRMLEKMFYASKPASKTMASGAGHRVRVFLEYLVGADADLEDIRVIDALGIRLHIHIYDDEIDLLESLRLLIEDNGGDLAPDASDELPPSEGAEGGGGGGGGAGGAGGGGSSFRKKGKKGKKAVAKKSKGPLRSYQRYEAIKSTLTYFDYVNTYLGNVVPYEERTHNTSSGESYMPNSDHPLHPVHAFRWEASLLPGLLPAQAVEGPAFALPDVVFMIPPQMWHPAAFMGLTLPRTPLWFAQPFEGQQNTMLTLMNKEMMESRFSDRFVKRNDLEELRVVQTAKVKRIKGKGLSDEETARELAAFRKQTVKYIAGTWKPGAAVSAPIQIMSKWAQEERTWSTGPPKLVDCSMSWFGNMMARMMIHLEKDYRISTTHAILLRVMVNSFDAYRFQFNLHSNLLLLGQGATGKSYMLDVLQAMCVPDTVKKVTHSTDKAATIDSDDNDRIHLFHELPPGMLGQDKGSSGDTGSGIIKDAMTSCEVETRSIVVDNDGPGGARRIGTSFKSQCVGVIIGATNERSDTIPEALSTRMIKVTVSEYDRPGFSVNDMTTKTNSVRHGDYEDPASTADFERRFRCVQVMLNMVNKMVYTHNLVDVGMEVFDVMQRLVTAHLIDKGVITNGGNIREIRFLKHFARTLTIMHACDRFANDPASPAVGKEFSFATLQAIQPLLFVTEEIALFVLTLNADQLIKTNHFRVVELLLHACHKSMVKAMDGSADESNGYYFTRAVYRDERDIYRALIDAQYGGEFDTRLSPENIKVAFNEIRKESHDGRPIVSFSQNTQSISINKAYVDRHFQWDDSIGRYTCRFDVNNVLKDAFNTAYASAHTRPQSSMLLGTTYDANVPFLFNTMNKVANPSRMMKGSLPISVDDGTVLHAESTAAYDREGGEYVFKSDFEQLAYGTYLEKCALPSADVEGALYRHNVPETPTKTYPEGHAEWFLAFNRVSLKRKRE